MTIVALHFPSLLELITFTQAIGITQYEIIKAALLLICTIPQNQIELAKKNFKATVVELEEN
jgi:hypothetical protein